jgi:hypothetical protein
LRSAARFRANPKLFDGAAWYPRQGGCIFSSDVLQFVPMLAIQPELRYHATQPFKAHGHFPV